MQKDPINCHHLSLISHTAGDNEITIRVFAMLRTDPTAKQLILFGSIVSFGMRVPAERPNLCYHLSLISHIVGDCETTLRVVALLRTDPKAKQLTKFSNKSSNWHRLPIAINYLSIESGLLLEIKINWFHIKMLANNSSSEVS